MSSEQMRAELEVFVNEGLQAGWRGWPLKSEETRAQARKSCSRIASLRVWSGGRNQPARLMGRLGPIAISA
jgi:hypothetical protein